jgi:hypothetical protein
MHPGKLPIEEAIGRHRHSFLRPETGSSGSPYHNSRRQQYVTSCYNDAFCSRVWAWYLYSVVLCPKFCLINIQILTGSPSWSRFLDRWGGGGGPAGSSSTGYGTLGKFGHLVSLTVSPSMSKQPLHAISHARPHACSLCLSPPRTRAPPRPAAEAMVGCGCELWRPFLRAEVCMYKVYGADCLPANFISCPCALTTYVP